MKITAKMRCSTRVLLQNDLAVVNFYPDYAGGANAEWAYATPAAAFYMNVRPEVPFESGKSYTVTFDDGE